ncbi:MAG: 3-oxoacyl-[acyl-carrier-protein] synthase-3 [Myxococcota bacterium]|jgi:3-oxoacyl-[acyl-carrier-protein] synthase-3
MVEPISITGIGHYLPARLLSNADLPPLDKPCPPEVLDRIGVTHRGWADDEETIPEMAARAARRALASADCRPEDLDFIVLANWTQRRFLPDFAPKLQALLGAPQAFAFDVSTSCSGFVFGVAIASGFLQQPRFSKGLVVASETTSKRARPNSKATLVFGDAAGAFVLERGAKPGSARLLDYELMTDGKYYEAMEINDLGHVVTNIHQKDLQALAIKSFAVASQRVLDRQGMTLDDVTWVVPHSGTAGIQALLLRTLEIPPERVLVNFPRIGNVSSAAIPAALTEFVDNGTIKPGDIVLSPTTGSGWYAAAMLYQL